tara:strand:- start:49600 stop:49827 length:228 start_codon:yes stop_codon:yes gene_type:complete
MNETNFSEAFIKANQKANIFIDDMDNPIYLCDVRRKQNNIFLTICIVGIAIYIVSSVVKAKEEAEKRASKFKHYQ